MQTPDHISAALNGMPCMGYAAVQPVHCLSFLVGRHAHDKASTLAGVANALHKRNAIVRAEQISCSYVCYEAVFERRRVFCMTVDLFQPDSEHKDKRSVDQRCILILRGDTCGYPTH